MHVTRVKISNIRAFRDGSSAVDLDFSPRGENLPRWIVVAGRNGAGKTTFLQAVALAIAGPAAARTLRATFADWLRNGTQSGRVHTHLRFSDADGFDEPDQKPNFDPLTGLRWSSPRGGHEPVMVPSGRKEPGGHWDPVSGPWSDNPQGWFLAGYGPFRRLSNATTTTAERLMSTPGRPSSLVSLFHEDASLSEAVPWLQQIYLRKLERVPGAAEVEDVVLRVVDDGLLPEGMRVLKVRSEGLWVRTPTGLELPLPSLSDGYRTVAALVLDLLKQLYHAYGHLRTVRNHPHIAFPHEGVVLIDEIDAHLHVSWQQRIGFWLKDHFPGLQFFVSTHSPFICQAADPRGLVRLPAPGEQGPARIVEGELYNRVVNGSADDAVLTDLFGLDTTYSPRSRDIRSEVARLEARAIMGQLTPEDQERLLDLQGELPRTLSSDVASALRDLGTKIDHAED